MTTNSQTRDHMFLKIGHRGAAGYEPENTLRSFRKAIDLGVDMIEFDVHRCKTGELVVIHDDTVDRTTNGQGLVSDKTFAELRALDAGKEEIPTLEEVLYLGLGAVAFNIELKGKGTAGPVARVIAEHMGGARSIDDFLVSSFDWAELQDFRRVDHDTRVGVLFEEAGEKPFPVAKELGAYSVNPPIELTTEKFVKEAHAQGLKVFVWTVNSKQDIARIKRIGADGAFSNYPDRL